ERFISFKNLRFTVFETQRKPHTRAWLAVEGDFRTGHGGKVRCVARFEKCAERSNAFLGCGNFKDGVRLQVAIPAGERLGVNARGGGGRRFRRELAAEVE